MHRAKVQIFKEMGLGNLQGADSEDFRLLPIPQQVYLL